MRVLADEGAQVAGPEIKLGILGRRQHTEVPQVLLSLFDGLVVAAHAALFSLLPVMPDSSSQLYYTG